MNYSIIQKSQLEGMDRIDAEYYQLEYLSAVETIRETKHERLGDIISLLTDYHANGSYQILSRNVNLSDDPDYALMVRAIDLEKNDYESDVRYVSRHAYDFLRKTKMYGQEIIIDKIGNSGEVFLMPRLERPVTLGMNLFMIRLKEDYEPAYVYSFLISKYGKSLIYQRITGTAPPSIDKESVRGILIPLPSKQTNQVVKSIIEDYLKTLEESKKFYSQAEDLLLEELGLKNAVFEDELSYVVNFSDENNTDRIDAEYFQPKYNVLASKIKEYGADHLTKIVQNVPARFSPELGETYKYVELANINSSIGTIDGFEKVLGKEAPSRAKRILKPGDVIVSSVEGSLEKIALVAESQNDYLASTGFFQFRSEKILPEALLILTKSIVIQWQMKKHCAGTILTAVPSDALDKMLIPVLPKTTQQKIAELVRKSHEARKKSKELLDKAKRKVEEIIEKGATNG